MDSNENQKKKLRKTENMKQYKKDYYYNNKDKLYTPVMCDVCNCNYSQATKYQHFHTRKHKNNVLLKELFEFKRKLDSLKENV